MKIHIFGASGSGVTTTGITLAQKLNFDYFDSDDYFWESSETPFTVKRNEAKRNTKIVSELNKSDNWILGGSIFQWNAPFPDFDLVIFLWIPSEIRIERLHAREFERYGNIIYNDPKRIKQYEDFISWASAYDNSSGNANRNIKAHEEWLEKISFPVLRIMGDLTLEQRIEFILEKLQ